MSATYSPQRHAAALADWTELLLHQSRAVAALSGDVAALRGDLARLVRAVAVPVDQLPDAALDQLVNAAFNAKGTATWITTELIICGLSQTIEAIELTQAIQATGKTNPRSLGKYLAGAVPGPSYLTGAGLEIRRCGTDGNSLVWTIARV